MSTALYRRYRPETFADVIGQEHVTEPLMAALQKNRVNHAYLFSGPRGCGKTTSARILARCLNCAEGPTPTPCGRCESCVELARNGAGSLDVIEIDAASHGGVDDARDLRERATFAPVRDRYKIFIIDEAHMVTSAGFNALLKIVEEPPEHIKFIFATTEPDKVIGTIRSRTHHYPFRLVPPEPLLAYLERLCTEEDVPVAPGVLSLVIRAGGGSVRDTLSVLDQLMAGAGPDGLDYELAVSLLGYTHVSLLDDVVDAFAAADAATVFRAVDRVIQTGQDPRRFVEDLLERFRDLIIVNAMPDSAAAVLRGMPTDQINRMQAQASQMGSAELSRAADITNAALTEMTGATSPRLHLELLCARILLPASEHTERGVAARVDRIERRLSYAGDGSLAAGRAAAAASPVPDQPAAAAAAPPAASVISSMPDAAPEAAAAAEDQPGSGADNTADWGGTWASPPTAAPTPNRAPAATATAGSQASARPSADGDGRASSGADAGPAGDSWPHAGAAAAEQASPRTAAADAWPHAGGPAAEPERPHAAAGETAAGQATQAPPGASSSARPAAQPAPATQPSPAEAPAPAPAEAQAQAASAGPAGDGGQVEMIRRAWPEIMEALSSIRRATWLNVSKNASPRAFDGKVLHLAFANPGAAMGFNRPDHLENLRQAVNQVLGIDCQINPMHDGTGESGPKAGSRPAPAPAQRTTPASGMASAAPAAAVSGGAPTTTASDTTGAPTQTVHPDTTAPTGRPASGAAGDAPAAARQGAPGGDGAAAHAAPADSTARRHPEHREPGTEASEQPSPGHRAPGRQTAEGSDTGTGPAARAADAVRPARQAPAQRAVPAPTRSAQTPAAHAPSAQTRSGSTPAPERTPGAPGPARRGAPLPADWQPEPSDPYDDMPESQAWTTAEVPDLENQGPDDAWHTTNWAGEPLSRTRPGTADGGTSGGGRPEPAVAGRGPGTGTDRSAPAPHGAHRAGTGPAPGQAPSAGPGRPAAGTPSSASAQPPVNWSGGAAAPSSPRPSAPAAPAAGDGAAEDRGRPNGRPMSRYQQLLSQARTSAPQQARPTAGNVDLSYPEDIPSADDLALEDAGLVGRKAIERILGGRLIEERSIDGS